MNGAANDQAIAAVTASLQKMLEDELKAVDPAYWVTTDTPDKAHDNRDKEYRLNLFLYETQVDAAWRNMELPPTRASQPSLPPLSLALYYLITAYSENDLDNKNHRMLGIAMRVLHDHPLLNPADITSAFAGSDLESQVERVRITLQPLSVDDMSKLWTMFQSQYRISAAYQVSLVLIESKRPKTFPLPVLKRGQEDRGVFSSVGESPSLDEVTAIWNLRLEPAANPPTLLIRPSGSQNTARLGDVLLLHGRGLNGNGIKARFSNPHLSTPLLRNFLPGDRPGEVQVKLDDPAADPAALSVWAPGLYTVALDVDRPPLPAFSSNELPLALAPSISVSPTTAAVGSVTLSVTVTPRLAAGQQPVLHLGSQRDIQAASITNPADLTQPTTVTFNFQAANEDKGTHLARLRVDGAESLPYAYQNGAIIFDPLQEVTIS